MDEPECLHEGIEAEGDQARLEQVGTDPSTYDLHTFALLLYTTSTTSNLNASML